MCAVCMILGWNKLKPEWVQLQFELLDSSGQPLECPWCFGPTDPGFSGNTRYRWCPQCRSAISVLFEDIPERRETLAQSGNGE